MAAHEPTPADTSSLASLATITASLSDISQRHLQRSRVIRQEMQDMPQDLKRDFCEQEMRRHSQDSFQQENHQATVRDPSPQTAARYEYDQKLQSNANRH